MRILEFGRDPLFSAVGTFNARWVKVGESLEPQQRFGTAPLAPDGIWGAIVGLVLRQYDFIIWPAIRQRAQGDADSAGRAYARQILAWLATKAWTARTLVLLFGLRHVPHIIRDVGDEPSLGTVSLSLFPFARLYAKRELLECIEYEAPTAKPPILYSPMAFDADYFPPLRAETKMIDVFFSGSLNTDERNAGRRVLEMLQSAGLEIDMCDGRIPYDEYLTRMSKAWLALSPRGYGEHCYRHYEALMMLTVPLISRPAIPVHYDLIDGETCFFYDGLDAESLKATVRTALGNKERLTSMARKGSDQVRAINDRKAVCRSLLQAAGIAAW